MELIKRLWCTKVQVVKSGNFVRLEIKDNPSSPSNPSEIPIFHIILYKNNCIECFLRGLNVASLVYCLI